MEDGEQNLVGQTLGTCTLEKLIGQGGMGSVYLARQVRPQRNVAVKVLLPNRSMGSQQDFLARFRREADVIAKLEHVNIMPIYEYGEKDGLAYLVMPYLSGGSLREVLSKQGSLSLEATMSYIDQAASALDYAHANGVIHRDLKPANFLLHADGRLVLADFGIARIMDEQTQGATLTGVGTLLGTPEYMAPEMARGEQIDYRADIYELGVVLFQMLAGYVPFSGATAYAIIYKHVQEPVPLLQYTASSIPPAVDAVIQKATAKNRADRYSTVKAMAQDLHAAISGSPVFHTENQNQSTVAIASSTPLVLPPPVQPGSNSYYPSYNTHTSQTPTPSNDYVALPRPQYPPPQSPYQPAYQPPVPQRRQHTWTIVLAVVFALIIMTGVLFAAVRTNGGRATNNPPAYATAITSHVRPTAAPQSTPTLASTTTAQPTAVATPATTSGTIPMGAQLYASPVPGCNNGTGQWFSYNGIQVNCQPNSAQLISTARKKALQGVFLTKIPDSNYPADYVVQVQLQPNQNSTGTFGIYFRNQPGNQLGAYAFLIGPDGRWVINVYDNNTGLATQLGHGSLGYPIQNGVQLAVGVIGPHIKCYINGQLFSDPTDGTYSTGTAGVAVGAGADVTATNFILSQRAP